MRTKSIYFAMIGFVVACLCTSCGDYWPADNVLVGKWSSLSDEIDTIRTYCEAHFKTQNRLYICEEQHRNEGVGQEKKYFHYYLAIFIIQIANSGCSRYNSSGY